MASQVLGTFVVVSCAFSVAFAQTEVEQDKDLIKEVAVAAEATQEVSTQNVLDVIPDATGSHAVRPECDPHRLEDAVFKKKLSTPEYFKVVKQYFAKCQYELAEQKGMGALIRSARYTYPFFQHPQIRKFPVKLDDGTVVPGILALKQDPRPRPLVIVRCGVFCSAVQTSSNKNYMMHLFDQSPFNVLFIANQTGMDYLAANGQVSMGGWSEGYETLLVGKWMREKWEHRDRISSIHMMGISLGGNAAVFGASYNDRFPLADGSKVFNSVTAICPVISLKPTLDKLYNSQLVGRVFAKETKDHFAGARQYLRDVPDLLAPELIPTSRADMPEFIGTLPSTSLQRRGIASTTESFFKSNNFWNLKDPVKTPLLVWASKDDSVVNNDINARVLENDDTYKKVPTTAVLNLTYGDHCGFSAAYGFQAAAAVLRTYVLNHSPEFVDSYVANEMPWKFGSPKLGASYQHAGQSFEFSSGSSQIRVKFKLFDTRGGRDCDAGNIESSPMYCFVTKDYTVSVDSLKSIGARIPRNSVEAQALTREFNTKVEFKSKGKALNGTRGSDITLVWRSLFE
ncbi:hypothetical protein [Bdellovibrio sp. HCB2-146]|uniref:hypothetical protein n=1 Tax=Bdellovibrio sp. HCB2-146 TaxID=3394362 RepID=UPI0039BD7D68